MLLQQLERRNLLLDSLIFGKEAIKLLLLLDIAAERIRQLLQFRGKILQRMLECSEPALQFHEDLGTVSNLTEGFVDVYNAAKDVLRVNRAIEGLTDFFDGRAKGFS